MVNNSILNGLPGPIRVPLKGLITLTGWAAGLTIAGAVFWAACLGFDWVFSHLNWRIVSWIVGIIGIYLGLGVLGATTWRDEH